MPDLGTRALVLEVDSTDFSSAVSDARITAGAADSDFTSFADARAGGAREYKLKLKLKQNTDTASLWSYMWAEAGTDVTVVLWPNGKPVGGTPDAEHPSFTGTVTITEPDGDLIGGEANKSSTARFTTEVEWTYTAKPTKAVGA